MPKIPKQDKLNHKKMKRQSDPTRESSFNKMLRSCVAILSLLVGVLVLRIHRKKNTSRIVI